MPAAARRLRAALLQQVQAAAHEVLAVRRGLRHRRQGVHKVPRRIHQSETHIYFLYLSFMHIFS